MQKIIILSLIVIGMFVQMSLGQDRELYGTVAGKVLDQENKQPLPGANVVIENSKLGAVCDSTGSFEIKNVKVGYYSTAVSFIGYEKVTRTDVIVKSDRITFLSIELKPAAMSKQNVVVTSKFFSETDVQPISMSSFSYEEIRRAPGTGGDVSRILFSLPSVGKINDTKNALVVRGGSPVENGFIVDNIEIPNINHFPIQGSSEGPIGIINLDFINDVNFFSGGFSSLYGNRLSSIMEMKFREGNRAAVEGQLEISLQGFGGVLEGPVDGGRGSFMISARRSYLDFLLKVMGLTVGLPVFGDVQGKFVYDLSENHKISILDIYSNDGQELTRQNSIDGELNIFGDYFLYTNTAGINWLALWGAKGYSNTSLAHTYFHTNIMYSQTRDESPFFKNYSSEQEYKFRNLNHYIISPLLQMDFGIDAAYFISKYDQIFYSYTNISGQTTPRIWINNSTEFFRTAAFLQLSWDIGRITIVPGIRLDHYSANSEYVLSPRISATYHLNDITSLTAAYGIYYQNIPQVILAQSDAFKKLKSPRAEQYIVGFATMLTESLRMSLEIYQKDYRDFPMDPNQPNQFLFDQAVVENFFMPHTNLVSSGSAESRGIELTIQKKLAVDFYGLLAAAYYRTRYKGLDNIEYNRVYDSKFNFTVEGGYKLNEFWEFSIRWIYSGGPPYSPFDENASRAANAGVFDQNRINGERMPPYHSLNLRADRRFPFQSSTLTAYLSIWNVYDRKNLEAYIWNETKNESINVYMWGILPVFGVEWEF